jgi:succinyl-diaminopimelate desuccinylase
LNAAVTVTGVAGHVAYSANAINPIPRAVGFMRELCEATFDNSSDEIFERTNIELTSIDVNNIATNVIPESIRIQFNIRFNFQHTHFTLVSFIENIAKKYSDVQWHFSYNFASIPFLSAPSEHLDYLVKICEGVNGAAPFVSTHGASSDARFLQNICPFVEVGLLAEQAHKINEHTTVADLLALHSIFYEVLRGFNAGRAFDTFV